ncbi:unnamed protein product [Parajaminaea phylloscopi]
MSFTFDFGPSGDEAMEDAAFESAPAGSSQGQPATLPREAALATVPSQRLDLQDLIADLPDRISYSFVRVPVASEKEGKGRAGAQDVYLARRDLFDARFQILHEGDEDGHGDVEESTREEDVAVVGTESDLIPGLYEGGLKTWECSVDLVGVLHNLASDPSSSSTTPARSPFVGTSLRQRRIVELGCGTALPSAYLLQHLLSAHPGPEDAAKPVSPHTHLHLCDYNRKVLQLVTLPNLLLAYHFSRAEQQGQPIAPGELDLTPEFLDAFCSDLQSRGIQIHFHSGPWSGLQLGAATDRGGDAVHADLILTSETTYSLSGVHDLVQVVQRISRGAAAAAFPSSTQSSATITDGELAELLLHDDQERPPPPTACLVSTKDYYFGLGGGVLALQQALQATSIAHWTRVVREFKAGVARTVLCLGWSH